MERNAILASAEAWVKDKLGGDSSGHDWWHIARVVNLAKRLAEEEGADTFICELTAILHDMADDKLNENPTAARLELEEWLRKHLDSEKDLIHILSIIDNMSYRGGKKPPLPTLEGRVVQDADRLDAIGAIGIARTFVYSGWKGRPMHDPSSSPRVSMTEAEYRSGNDTAVNHFYEKLLKLKDLMNTDAGKRTAAQRHTYMEQFLTQFYEEWDGKR